ncbi:MAG TPA: type IX secretion system sortase PorU [Prolixibacteraceae bacterium]|nr:type IX secretion system sortase PorU [Prolixibacteraceae bacterium]
MHRILNLIVFLFVPLVYSSGEVYSPDNELVSLYPPTGASQVDLSLYREHSILSEGRWVKVSASNSGILAIPYSRLKAWGIESPDRLAVYSSGGYMLSKWNNETCIDDLTRLPVLHARDKNGNDCVFFYSTGTTRWEWDLSLDMFVHQINLYSDSVFFYLSSDGIPSEAPSMLPAIDASPEIRLSTYTAYAHRENENSNLIRSGRNWVGERIYSQKNYSFLFPGASNTGEATLRMTALSRSSSPSNIDVRLNGNDLGVLNFSSVSKSSHGYYADLRVSKWEVLPNSEMDVELAFESIESGAEAWIDFITLNVESALHFSGEPLLFRSRRALQYDRIEYEITVSKGSPLVWDLTQPLNPQNVALVSEQGRYFFQAPGRDIGEYVVFDPATGTYPEPVFSGNVRNQDIHGLPAYDMIIVTHPLFQRQAEELAEFHRRFDNLELLVLTTTEVFNEFSSGIPDVAAIRNMTRMFYERQHGTTRPLKYLLLFGDGSYDNRKLAVSFDEENYNFIPTYQTEESLNDAKSAVSDDFFGLLEPGEGEIFGTVDVGIGRIPCRTTLEAEIILSKIIGYASSEAMGEWRNSICFIADDEDWNSYMDDSEELIDSINQRYPGFFVDKIYFDSYQQVSTSAGEQYPDVTLAINNRVNKGALILNYMGHANPQSLAHEKVLGVSDIRSWSNTNALPVFVTATCEFSRFDDDATSAGEEILLNPTGGGVALFTTTRLVYQSNNAQLSRYFYQALFEHDEAGGKLRLGDAIRMAKNKTDDYNMRNFSLLSDPALRLSFPRYRVKTLSINEVDPGNDSLKIGALDKVTIRGEINDLSGQRMTDFNGTVMSTIFDKEMMVQTLQNDGMPVFVYPVQNSVIYKGSSEVKNGVFEFSFIVPKDISYSVGEGKIIYYASNSEVDANGALTGFLIGGSSDQPLVENTPPEMSVFINSEDFQPYDKVSTNSLLLVKLFDESGINTVGAGIGHDLVAVLDDDYSQQMVLNDYYRSEINDYQRGTILFPLNNLEPGEHTIRVKVWDVQNQSAEAEVAFIVEDGFEITGVKTYPTRVTSFTEFKISHNLPGDIFETRLEIFNLLGQRVHLSNETLSSRESTTLNCRWDIARSNLQLYTPQMLVYRLTLVNQKGLTATGTGKLFLDIKN